VHGKGGCAKPFNGTLLRLPSETVPRITALVDRTAERASSVCANLPPAPPPSPPSPPPPPSPPAGACPHGWDHAQCVAACPVTAQGRSAECVSYCDEACASPPVAPPPPPPDGANASSMRLLLTWSSDEPNPTPHPSPSASASASASPHPTPYRSPVDHRA